LSSKASHGILTCRQARPPRAARRARDQQIGIVNRGDGDTVAIAFGSRPSLHDLLPRQHEEQMTRNRRRVRRGNDCSM
jgi:hypothetical protein